MNDSHRLHEEAMELVDKALIQKKRGEADQASDLFNTAFQKERLAAMTFKDQIDFEPTRSILFRSASSLALECNELREAERLIAMGLSGDPPEEISEELRDLLERVHFKRHLKLRGIVLREEEVQMALTGNAVSLGMTESSELYNRIRNVEKIVYRTAERLLHRPYTEAGRKPKGLKKSVELFISVPRAASFAVTFKIGSDPQLEFPGIGLAGRIIDDFLENVELFDKSKERELIQKISDTAYLRNFSSLARSILPDGDRIKTVGFTAFRDEKEKHVVITRRRERLQQSLEQPDIAVDQFQVVTLEGVLRFADVTKNKHEIRCVDSNDKEHRIIVPEGMMDDIVRPMWDTRVIVRGKKKGRSIELESIDPVEE